MATSKTGGSTSNGRESQSKRLGCKKFAGEVVIPGNILIRQRGTKIYPGNGVKIGKDDTLFAVKSGFVKFYKGFKGRQFISVIDQRA
ncbi:MAG: 50S ribosomal protein L27 [candidate division TM6 bacterium GW2011_GWF2_28_16]|jgi:large subunit ribosomal protein L27|nr:MAG: 50S ribosomal protein L27 [candidate division TM6 bacterium GW2011_GWF2_28_16]